MNFNSHDSSVVKAVREVQHSLTDFCLPHPSSPNFQKMERKETEEKEGLFLVEHDCVEDTFSVFLLTYCVHQKSFCIFTFLYSKNHVRVILITYDETIGIKRIFVNKQVWCFTPMNSANITKLRSCIITNTYFGILKQLWYFRLSTELQLP